MKLAIVILNWNGSRMMQQYLPSVILYSTLPGVEIIVADNASTDDSISMLSAQFPSIRILKLDQNYGFAEGYNRALAQVREAEYWLLLNSDVEVTEGWLEPMLHYMDTHPEVAACQPKIRSVEQREFFEFAGAAGGFIDRYGYPFCRGRLLSFIEKDKGQYNEIQKIFWATGAALFIRSKDFQEAGGLDSRFFAHMEEIDLCWRLNARGRDLVCIPQSTVYHLGGGTLPKSNPRKTFLNFRNNLLMLYKNLPEEELHKIMYLRWILDYLAALSFLLKGNIGEFKAVFKARKEYMNQRHLFRAEREENLKRAIRPVLLPGKLEKSIVFLFYFKKRCTFGKLFATDKSSV